MHTCTCIPFFSISSFIAFPFIASRRRHRQKDTIACTQISSALACYVVQTAKRSEEAATSLWAGTFIYLYPTLHRLNCDFHHASQRDFYGLSGQSKSCSGWRSVSRGCSIGGGATRLWRYRHSGFLVVISPSTIQPRILHRYQEEDCRHPTRRAARCLGCVSSWIYLG